MLSNKVPLLALPALAVLLLGGKTEIESESKCIPIGRVFDEGKSELACADSIKPGPVTLACFSTAEIIRDYKDSALPKCPVSLAVDRCRVRSSRGCPVSKGPDEAIALLSPRSRTLLERPHFEWDGASNGKLFIQGHGISFSKEFSGNSLPFPKELDSLKPGKVYQVAVETPEGTLSSSFRVLSLAERQKLINFLHQLPKEDWELVAAANNFSFSELEKIKQ